MTDDIEGIMTAEEWAAVARRKLGSAKVLRQTKRWEDAYHLAGEALECALKAKIMRHQRLNSWPSRAARPELYVHDPTALMLHAGLEPALLVEVTAATSTGTSWLVAKDWTVNSSRYATKVKLRLARDMVDAVEELIRWML